MVLLSTLIISLFYTYTTIRVSQIEAHVRIRCAEISADTSIHWHLSQTVNSKISKGIAEWEHPWTVETGAYTQMFSRNETLQQVLEPWSPLEALKALGLF